MQCVNVCTLFFLVLNSWALTELWFSLISQEFHCCSEDHAVTFVEKIKAVFMFLHFGFTVMPFLVAIQDRKVFWGLRLPNLSTPCCFLFPEMNLASTKRLICYSSCRHYSSFSFWVKQTLSCFTIFFDETQFLLCNNGKDDCNVFPLGLGSIAGMRYILTGELSKI